MTYDETKAFMKSINDILSEGKSFKIKAQLMSDFVPVELKITPKEQHSKPDIISPVGLWTVNVSGRLGFIHPLYPLHDGVVLSTDTHIEIPITPDNII